MASSDAPTPSASPKFGTFLGVYTPSVLTILGLIMYLRFGWVVGNLGLPLTLLTVLLASSITFITALSASAVATNMRVGVGGEYYMISRSLGLELGGAIGIPLFLCRTLSITFYSFGLSESIISLTGGSIGTDSTYNVQLLAALIIVITTAVAGKSAGLALKSQIPIMAAVGLSLIALAVGVFSGELSTPELQWTFRSAPPSFWYVFAVFFPAVTGFTAGIGMSGDLRDPRKSIPRGTLLAVATGSFIYLLVPILLSISTKITPEELSETGVSWVQVAALGAWIVYPGMWGAILSSAFGSALGGPRVLQALANDGLAPRAFARLSKSGQPTVATWVCGLIALLAVALGGLNAVAQFVTILFLTLYVTINLSAGLERLVGDPSYRPTIEVPWYVSLAGSLGAVFVMFLISPLACVIAIILELALYGLLRRRAMKKRWGDLRAGLWVALARFALLKLRRHELNPRNWRPHILLFAEDATKRIGLVRLANWFNQNRGLVTVCQLVEGDLEHEHIDIDGTRKQMDSTLADEGLLSFSEVDVVMDFERGAIVVAQANGIAGLQSNTVMFGWPKREERLTSILRIMRAVSKARKSTIIAKPQWAHEPGQEKRIDVWWRGKEKNGDLMLLLAYLLKLNAEWQDARIIVRSIVQTTQEREEMESSLAKLMPEVRIQADSEIIIQPPGLSVVETMHQCSSSADIVFMGLRAVAPGEEEEYAKRMVEMASGLNTTIFVLNAEEFAGSLI